MTPLDTRPGTERHNTSTNFFGIMLGEGRKIVAVGPGAEEVVRARVAQWRSEHDEQA